MGRGVSILAGLCFCSEIDAQSFAAKVAQNLPSESGGVRRASNSGMATLEPPKGIISRVLRYSFGCYTVTQSFVFTIGVLWRFPYKQRASLFFPDLLIRPIK